MAVVKQLVLVPVITTILLMEKSVIFSSESFKSVPSVCLKYTQFETVRPISLCGLQPKNSWHRFKSNNESLNEVLHILHVENDKINDILSSPNILNCPEQLVPIHPCHEFGTISSKVCFRLKSSKPFGVAVNITNCGTFYIYQLPQLTCENFILKLERRNYTHPPNCKRKDPDISPTIELEKRVDELGRTNISEEVRAKKVQKIIDRLSYFTDLDKMGEERKKDSLTQQDLNDTARILKKIVQLNISDRSFNILGPVNNILDSRNTMLWRNMSGGKIIRDLIITIEDYGFNYQEHLKRKPSALAIFQNYSNVELHVKYIKQAKNLSEKERLFQFSDASFEISSDALPHESSALVVVTWYKTLHSFVRNSLYGDNSYVEVNSEVIIASVRPKPRKKFSEPVRISWNTTRLNDSETCVYWKPELKENEWRTDGCLRGKSENNRLICECYHLTAFAFMDISRDLVNESERETLELISTIGCSLSLFGIFLTMLTNALLWKKLHLNAKSKVPSHVLLHLCIAIGMTDILAIFAGPAKNWEPLCKAVSILLYFFVLAVFAWMLCEGILVYLQLVKVFKSLSLGGKHLKLFYLIGWGFPVLLVTLMVGINDSDHFITKYACWNPAGGVLFWTFAVSCSLMLMVNLMIFILTLRSVLYRRLYRLSTGGCSTTTTDATLKRAKVGLKVSAVLLPLLGLTWTFGLLVFNRDTIAFKYLFAICNSLQGAMIFVFHVLLNKKIQQAIKETKASPKARNSVDTMTRNNIDAISTTTSGSS